MFLDSQTVWCQKASCSTDTLTRNRWNHRLFQGRCGAQVPVRHGSQLRPESRGGRGHEAGVEAGRGGRGGSNWKMELLVHCLL